MACKTRTGIEVEGRLSGVRTLFVHDALPNTDDYAHVYFNPVYLAQYGYADALRLVESKLITLCVYPTMLDGVPERLLQSAHIVVAILVTQNLTKKLKAGDEIRLDFEEYENATAQMRSFIQASREDYAGDVIVKEG